MGYKMKGFSGFKESPVKQKPGGSVGEALEHHKKFKAKKSMPKDFNTKGSKGSKTPGFSTTKLGKFLSSKTLGVLSLLGAGTLSASASNKNVKKSEGEQIKNLLTKHKLKGGNN